MQAADKKNNKKLGKVEVPPPSENMDAQETELRKKLRNLNKKLNGIKDLDAKIKSGEVTPDDAQKAKVAQKKDVFAEITEVEHEIVNYLKSKVAEQMKAAEEKAKKEA